MAKFSWWTRQFLGGAGWKDGRVIETQKYETTLLRLGFRLFPTVITFYSSFGELIIGTAHFGQITINSDCCEYIDPETIKDQYARRAGELLAPFGEWGDYILCMTPEGKVYGGIDHYLVWIGNSGEEMIERLCSMKDDETKLIP
jgi:hypothetical protein